MSKLKATKNLVRAIIALVVSLVLCIGVCLAWFSSNGQVWGNGLNSEVETTNVDKFTVTAFKLQRGADDDFYTVVGDEITDKVSMAGYGGLVTNSTALLLKFTYKFKQNLGGSYKIYASCESLERVVEKVAGGEDKFNCNLSDAVTFTKAETEKDAETGKHLEPANGVRVDAVADGQGNEITFDFFDEETVDDVTVDVKTGELLLQDGVSDSAVEQEISFYYIIDYADLNISKLYSIAINKNGTLNSAMSFGDDIRFILQEV